jgi:hypothetical protein
LLASALDTSPELITCADASESPGPATFFRAPASLTLPDSAARRVGVAALILRPDRRTSHLEIAGIYDWPSHSADAIHSLERLIQAYAGQWMPPRALWNAPAEMLLKDEVY